MMPPGDHGVLSPSRLQRIVDCPGSFKFAQTFESKQSWYADEGSMLHSLTEKCIKSGFEPTVSDIPEPWANQGLDDDYLAAVNDCLDYYNNLVKTIPDAQIQIESQVYLKDYDPCLYDCYGTCDVIIKGSNELHIIDWKFGKGVPVYSKENDQLYAYAAGALLDYGKVDQIYIHCVQPRLNSYDTHIMTESDISFWLRARVIPGVKRAQGEDAPFNPGTAQCRWCPAKVQCRARNNFANQTAADIFKAHVSLKSDEVPLIELSETLRKADAYEEYISDLRQWVQQQIEQGSSVPGWKVVAGRSNRRFINEEDAIDWMMANCDGQHDRLFKTKLISPAEAERKFRHWKKDQEFYDLIEKPPGKNKLVIENDPRPALEFKTATEKFKEAIENENTEV